MAAFAIYIEKSFIYEGSEQVFGNTYHLQADGIEPFDDEAASLEIAAAERAVTELRVNFKRWVTWGPTDGPEIDNVMRADGALAGTGAVNFSDPLYASSCIIVRWPLPRSPVTNRKRFLRKFLRNAVGVGTANPGLAEGRNPLSADAITAMLAYATDVRTVVTASGTYELCNERGDVATLDTPVVNPYLQTRQIGR